MFDVCVSGVVAEIFLCIITSFLNGKAWLGKVIKQNFKISNPDFVFDNNNNNDTYSSIGICIVQVLTVGAPKKAVVLKPGIEGVCSRRRRRRRRR